MEMKRLIAVLICLLLPVMASAQTIRVEPSEISLGGGAMIGENGIIASWDSAFAAIQWRGVQMFADNFVSGVALEVHPAAVLSFKEGNALVQYIEQVDFRVWSMNRVTMSALPLPGEIWESMFIGTDLLVYEGGSKDHTGDFSARLVFGVQEKAGPGFIDLEIYMFEKYRPVSFAMFYRYNF